jgi:rod shape-determining protein MreD
MRRAALAAGAVVVALVLQLSLVDRLPLPGGTPDLVLVVVVALGLTGGPMAGLLTGFWAGLALDIAPPASYLLGEHALVFCLVGYGCGRLSGITDRSAASSIGIAAMAVAGGEVLQVIVGLMFGDPGVNWSAIQVVLPSAVLQDILISPFVVYLMMRAISWAAGSRLGSAAGDTVPGLLAGAGRGSLVDGALLAGPGGNGWLAGLPGFGRGRKAGALASVRFSKYAARPGDGRANSGPGSWRVVRGQVAGGRQRRLRPGAGQAGSAIAGQVQRRRPVSPVSIRMGSGRRSVGAAFQSGSGRGSAGLGSTSLRGGLRGASLRGSGLRGASLRGASLLGSGRGSGGLGSAGPGGGGPRGASLRGAGLRGASLRGASLRGAGAVNHRFRISFRGSSGRVSSGRFRAWRVRAGRGLAGGGPAGGGLAGGSASRPSFRSATRRVAPRFRRAAAAPGPRAFRQPRFRPRRNSSLGGMTTRRAMGRPAWWRIGRRRKGGFS